MKKTLLTLALIVCTATVSALPVSLDDARRAAETFWLKNHPAGYTGGNVSMVPVENTGFVQMYIFDINSGEGFIIVSADDCAYPILGYSLEHPAGEMGANVRFWLGQYEAEIAYLVEQNTQPNDYIARQWRGLLDGTWEQPKRMTSVSPLLTTTWNQSPYYNNLCPSGTPAGCTAIAVAQVMKFWNYPVMGTGSYSYTHSRYGMQSADFGNTTYDWANMPNRLTSSSTSAQVNAVATLCYHVGVSINMDYDPSGSGAALIGSSTARSAHNALKNYFGYRSTLQGVYKSNYSDAAWVALLKDELDAGRPIPYAGFDNSAGHAFVFHGYNSSDQFCVNWGWGGSYDGYFTMGALNPTGGGTGTNTTNTFNISNQCIIGLQPSGALRLSKSSINLPQTGTAASFVVSSNSTETSAWTATASQSWLTLSPSTGSGNGALTTVSVSATPNTTGTDRSAIVTVRHGGDSATVTVSQLACNPDDMCTLTVNMSDQYSDGWEGAYLTFSSTSGTVFGTATVGGGAYAIEHISVCLDTVVVTWHSGSHDSECGFSIQNANNVFFYNHVRGNAITNGELLAIPSPCDTAGGIGPVTYTLTGVPSDTACGRVTGGGENIAFGTTRTLRAEAYDGYRFVKWNDNSTDNPRSVVVTADRTYTATYATLGDDTLHYDNGSYVTALGAGNNMCWGIKLTADDMVGRPELTGIQFFNVYSGNYTITIYKGGNINPTTQIYQGTISLSSQYTQRWITLNFDTPVEVTRNKSLWITLSAPGVSYPAAMASWCGNENGSMISTNGGSSWRKLTQMSRYGTWMLRAIAPIDHTQYTVTAMANNPNYGTVEGGGFYSYGDRCTLTATPNVGYHFNKWSNDAASNPYTFTVTEDVVIRAVFASDQGITTPDGQTVTLLVSGQSITASGAEGHDVSVYDLAGRLLHHAETYDGSAIQMASRGVYMVSIDGCPAQRVVIL